MAADPQEPSGNTEADARMQIQDIIDELKGKFLHVLQCFDFLYPQFFLMFTVEELNLTEPGNLNLDGKIDMLDRIFTECKFSY